MNKILKMIGIVFLILMSLIIIDLIMSHPKIKHANCYASKGEWKLFGHTCVDSCDQLIEELACGDAETYGCDCGPNLCWDGKKCISNRIVCKTDEDCKKNSIETRCDYKTKEKCENSGGNWVIPIACLAIGCPDPGPPYCECDANCIDNRCV